MNGPRQPRRRAGAPLLTPSAQRDMPARQIGGLFICCASKEDFLTGPLAGPEPSPRSSSLLGCRAVRLLYLAEMLARAYPPDRPMGYPAMVG